MANRTMLEYFKRKAGAVQPVKLAVKQPSVQENKEQLEFIEAGLKDLKLLGVPGGGKTRCIIRHIVRNLEEGAYSSSREYVVLTFSKSAQLDFVKKGGVYSPRHFNVKNVRTIHSLALYIVNNALGLKVSCVNESFNQYIVKAIELLDDEQFEKRRYPQYAELKMVYVDEAQDISDMQWAFIQLLRRRFDTYLAMAGDPNQNIYQFQKGSDKYLMEFQAEHTVRLVMNYRSSKSLIPLFNAMAPHATCMAGTFDNGVRPRVVRGSIAKIREDILRGVWSHVRGDARESCAVIGPVKKSYPLSRGQYNAVGLSLIREYFEEHGIPYEQMYGDGSASGKSKLQGISYEGVHLHTIHTSKGLEYDHTYIINFHHRTMVGLPTEEAFEEHHYLWYVAMTRCRKSLTVYILEGEQPFHSMSRCDAQLLDVESYIPFPSRGELRFSNDSKVCALLQEVVAKVQQNPLLEREYRKYMDIDELEVERNASDLVDYGKYVDAYGMYLRMLYGYYYGSLRSADYNALEGPVIRRLHAKYTNAVEVPERHWEGYRHAIRTYAPIRAGAFFFEEFSAVRNQLSGKGRELYEYVYKTLVQCNILAPGCMVFLYTTNSVQNTNFERPVSLMKKISAGEDIEKNMFLLCIFEYQLINEKKHLINKNFDDHLDAAEIFARTVQKNVQMDANFFENKECSFEISCKNKYLPIYGTMDMECGDWLVSFCWGESQDYSQCVRAAIASMLWFLAQRSKSPGFVVERFLEKRLLVYNLLTNQRYEVKLRAEQLMAFIYQVAETAGLSLHDTCILYDLETTGLDTDSCAITEAYFHNYTLDLPMLHTLVRTDLAGRSIYPDAHNEALTGISAALLQREGVSCEEFSAAFTDMSSRLHHSCEFHAYNGNGFDHKVMNKYFPSFRKYSKSLQDSKMVIRAKYLNIADILKLPSYKLVHVYKHICRKESVGAHRARADVLMLNEIYRTICIE